MTIKPCRYSNMLSNGPVCNTTGSTTAGITADSGGSSDGMCFSFS